MRGRQIHAPEGHLVFYGPLKRPPLRGKFGEGVKGGVIGPVHRVDHQRNRRNHAGKGERGQVGAEVGWKFHQQQVRSERVERLLQAARAAGAVVSDAEE